LKTNADNLVKLPVVSETVNSVFSNAYAISAEGKPIARMLMVEFTGGAPFP